MTSQDASLMKPEHQESLCPQCGARTTRTTGDVFCYSCQIAMAVEQAEDGTASFFIDVPGGSETEAALPEHIRNLVPGVELTDVIGRGGMGIVYLGKQTRLDRDVAVKVIRRSSTDESFAERFAREARTMAKMSHPGIVSVHDFGQNDDVCWFVMEYIDGHHLRAVIQDRVLPVRECLEIAIALCDALEYAHGLGIVHRDIKPENVLIDDQGHVSLADFGIAKLAPAADMAQLTRTREVLGTPLYMAPEQCVGARDVDARADIYSLGVVLFEMITGEQPTGGMKPSDRRDSAEIVDGIVHRCLQESPERRFADVGELREALRGARRHFSEPSLGTVDSPNAAPAAHAVDLRVADGRRRWLGILAWAAVGAVTAAVVLASL